MSQTRTNAYKPWFHGFLLAVCFYGFCWLFILLLVFCWLFYEDIERVKCRLVRQHTRSFFVSSCVRVDCSDTIAITTQQTETAFLPLYAVRTVKLSVKEKAPQNALQSVTEGLELFTGIFFIGFQRFEDLFISWASLWI